MAQFRARLDDSTKGTYFEHGRSQYLTTKTAAQVMIPRLCNVLEEINDSLGRPYGRSGYPWITPVLGTGCLEAGRDLGGTSIRQAPARVEQLLAEMPPLPDGSSPALIARAFTASLIADRLGLAGVTPANSTAKSAAEGSADVSLYTARLVLFAALLTRLYHLASAAVPDALSRAGRDQVRLDGSRAGSAELRTEALEPAQALLAELFDSQVESEGVSADQAMTDALRTVRFSLDATSPKLKLVDVQLITELAWYSLTHGTTVYPGWSDLLLHLSTRRSPVLMDRLPPRPFLDDIDAARSLVADRYDEVTRRSWRQLVDSDQSERERFYATVAAMLREQARLRATSPTSSPQQPPIASAFVTSFDLELEMALWRAGTDPYVIAVPVYLLQEVGDPPAHLASVCWLGCMIRPDHDLDTEEQLERLREPAQDDWFVLNGEDNYELKYGNYPVVARLSGSPLMAVPALWHEDGQWNDLCRVILKQYNQDVPEEPATAHDPELRLVHVAMLDEYSAMQHAAVEFFTYGGGDQPEWRRTGLPVALSMSRSPCFARFWMMLGVQISDSSIRYRFASQLAAPENMESRPPGKIRYPKRAGLVVNWRTDDTVRELLGWYNFDVVVDRCESFQGDLQHYVRHLQIAPRRGKAREACLLP
jgi:hypothetical protein